MLSVEELIQQAQIAEREGRRDDARSLYERALYSLKRAQDGRIASSLLRWVARTYQADDPDAALDCLEAAIAVAQLASDAAAIGHAINVRGNVHQQQGNLDQAEGLYLEARSHAIDASETRLAAMTAQNLGVISMVRGDHEKTLRYYRTSLAEFRTLGAPKEVLLSLNNMGMLCTDLERWDDATRAFDEAVQIADALGDIPSRVLLEVNRAELEIVRGDFIVGARRVRARPVALVAHPGRIRRRRDREAPRHRGARDGRAVGGRRAPRARAEDRRRATRPAALRRDGARARGAVPQAGAASRCADAPESRPSHLLAAQREARPGRHRSSATRASSATSSTPCGTGRVRSNRRTGTRRATASAWRISRARSRCEPALEPRELFWFRIGAIVHDVGKLIIPSEILNKPGKLAPDEWELIKRHPVAGVEMLADMDFPGDVIPMVRSHHERWDGRGYPDGLAGEHIPRSARILCIADVYDALMSKRSYKGALSHEAALEIMRADVTRQFDPELFEHFEALTRTRPQTVRQRAVVEPQAADRPAVRDFTINGPSDDLTGLLMRRPFVDLANKILAERGPFATVSLLVIDVDEFKHVNDSHGHLQGDAVLRVVAGTLRELAASTGIIGRYAGDEFVILLPHTPADEAAELAERIRGTVRRASVPLRERSGSISVTLSIGVVGARPEHTDFDALFEAADRALYEAKRRGRDTVVSASEGEEPSREPSLNLKQFVGREEEMHRLVRLLEATMESGPRLASVIGEAGVGKSTLVRRLASEVRLRAGSLVGGRCVEADAKPPYAPWAEVIAAIHQLGVVARHDWRELPRLVPALGASAHEPSGNKYTLFDEIVSYLRLAAGARPVVIVLDDMQWSDSATWDVLEHVMTQLEHERVMICLTLRSEDSRGEATERRNRLLRDERFHEIALSRLSEQEIQQWLAGVFGADASRDLLAYCQRYSEGNPLLATQLVRMLLDDGAVRYEHGRWVLRAERDGELPAALTGLMDRRLERLSANTRRILNTASVIGRTFDIDLAIAAGAGPEDEVLDALDEGMAHAVLEPSQDIAGSQFSFTHGLLVDAVRRTINPRRLSRIHERVAVAMEERTPDNAAEIAIHYDRAGIPHKAFRHAMAAGGAALAMYAHAEARRFFEIAERAASDPVERAHALHRLAEVAETEGRYALTEELCDRALAGLAGRSDDNAILGLRRMRERTRALQGQPASETIAACRELLSTARSLEDRSEEAALLNMISQYQGRLGEWQEAEVVAREAVAAAEQANDARLLAEALTRLGTSMMDRRSDEAAVFYQRALAGFRSVNDRCGEARCHINIGIIHQRSGEVSAAEAAYDRALEAANSAHAVDLAGLASLNLGVLYMRRGQLDLAGERFEDALARFTESSNESHRLATLYNMAHLARESEDWATASTLYDQVFGVAARIGQPDVELGARAGQALAALAVGARSVAEDAMRWIRTNVEPRPEWWFQGRDLVDALRIRLAAERGDDAHALRLLHEAVAIAGQYDPYVAAYLVAECAPSLRRSTEALLVLIDQISPEAEALGFAGVAERLSVLRIALAGSSQAA